MRKPRKRTLPAWGTAVGLTMLLFFPGSAMAGMTVYGLNDIYRLRMEEISFFLFAFIVSALLFKWLWNVVAKDFAVLPKLKFKHAAALSLTLGLGMLLILTMISGIREVLTPDAWRRQGSGYKLNSPVMLEERRWHIQQLRDGLISYARGHDGQFPPHDFVEELPTKLWEAPGPKRLRYHYRAGADLDDAEAMIAWEPKSFGDEVFALFADGTVQLVVANRIGAN